MVHPSTKPTKKPTNKQTNQQTTESSTEYQTWWKEEPFKFGGRSRSFTWNLNFFPWSLVYVCQSRWRRVSAEVDTLLSTLLYFDHWCTTSKSTVNCCLCSVSFLPWVLCERWWKLSRKTADTVCWLTYRCVHCLSLIDYTSITMEFPVPSTALETANIITFFSFFL